MSSHCENSVMVPLRFGLTLAELNTLARQAVTSTGPMGSDGTHRFELAWMGIAEFLYTVEEAPTRNQLLWAGRQAIYADVRSYRRNNGVLHGDMAKGLFSSRAFWRYWWHMFWSVPSHEDGLVEKVALHQVLAALQPSRRDALVALAVWGRYDYAAMSLDISYHAFVIRLNSARADFRRLWHQGEVPSRMWGSDQRTRKRM